MPEISAAHRTADDGASFDREDGHGEGGAVEAGQGIHPPFIWEVVDLARTWETVPHGNGDDIPFKAIAGREACTERRRPLGGVPEAVPRLRAGMPRPWRAGGPEVLRAGDEIPVQGGAGVDTGKVQGSRFPDGP
ncbi:MAG: hypothetical protein LLG21_01460 [Euryarchaeota archaeon]|nr:hypothetical protein [Euryarchaeota archaeon]